MLAALPHRRLAGESAARHACAPEAVCLENAGFTLIELSIVLVIIGLVVGGVLVGRDLIGAAAVRAQITQIEKYNTAANTFYGKYGALPGDISEPNATLFGFSSIAPRGSQAGQGDGNGIIYGFAVAGCGCGNQESAGETVVFWVDLSTAHMIDGGFSQARETSFPSGTLTASSLPGLSSFFPQSPLGYNNFVYVFSGGSYNGSWISNGVNYFGLSQISSVVTNNALVSTPGLTVQQAFSIDNKVDDGLPQSGRIQANYVNTNLSSGAPVWASGGGTAGTAPGGSATPSSTTCYDNGGNASNQMAYSVTQNNGNGVNCALSFKMQAGD